MPVKFQHYNGNTYKYDKGIHWILVFHHDSSTGKYFVQNSFDYLYVKEKYKYSILSHLEEYRLDGGFEFLLEYPELSYEEYNHWYQTSNPTTSSSVSDYEIRNISWTVNKWYGLSLSSSPREAFIDGSSENWHYALGAYGEWFPGEKNFPGPYNSAGPGKEIIHEVFLWVKIPKCVYDRIKGRLCTYRRIQGFRIPMSLIIVLISY